MNIESHIIHSEYPTPSPFTTMMGLRTRRNTIGRKRDRIVTGRGWGTVQTKYRYNVVDDLRIMTTASANGYKKKLLKITGVLFFEIQYVCFAANVSVPPSSSYRGKYVFGPVSDDWKHGPSVADMTTTNLTLCVGVRMREEIRKHANRGE